MDMSLTRALTSLPKGALLCVPAGRGKGIAVFQGEAWVTQERDSRDVYVGAGESFALDRPGTAIVQALADTRLLVFQAGPQSSPAVRGARPSGSAGLPPPAAPPSSYELHRWARQMRNDEIAAAARAAVESARLFWTRLWARA